MQFVWRNYQQNSHTAQWSTFAHSEHRVALDTWTCYLGKFWALRSSKIHLLIDLTPNVYFRFINQIVIRTTIIWFVDGWIEGGLIYRLEIVVGFLSLRSITDVPLEELFIHLILIYIVDLLDVFYVHPINYVLCYYS